MTSLMTEYQIDVDPVHAAIRLTITAEVVTPELAKEIYGRLAQISSSGVEYAAIYDLTMVKDTTIPIDVVRRYAHRPPAVPMGRPHVVVGESPAIFGLARIFQMCREFVHGRLDVVHRLEDAYKIVGVRPEDLTERL